MAQEFTVRWEGAKVKRAERAGAAVGLKLAVEHLLTESRPLAPLEEGILRNSGRASVDEEALQGAVSYDTPYAVRQHEDLSLRHVDGQAKYLEEPLNSLGPTIQALVATAIRRSLGGR